MSLQWSGLFLRARLFACDRRLGRNLWSEVKQTAYWILTNCKRLPVLFVTFAGFTRIKAETVGLVVVARGSGTTTIIRYSILISWFANLMLVPLSSVFQCNQGWMSTWRVKCGRREQQSEECDFFRFQSHFLILKFSTKFSEEQDQRLQSLDQQGDRVICISEWQLAFRSWT